MKTELLSSLRGTGVALVTPFTDDLQVDYDGLEKLLNHTGPHVDYFVVNGTTAESPTLSNSETMEILAFVASHNPWDKPIVWGMGGNDTSGLVAKMTDIDFSLVSAILTVTPYYNCPNQAGLLGHYQALADASPKPIILYNVPKRTGTNLSAATTAELALHPNIIAIKEASGDLRQCVEVKKLAPKDFLLLSGDDMLTIPMMAIGCQGVISVLANALPKPFCEMINLGLSGDFSSASEVLFQIADINDLMYTEGNPVGVKAALNEIDITGTRVRLPLAEASESLRKSISHEMKAF